MLLQYLLIHMPRARKPITVLSEVPKYWLESDGTMCLYEIHRWRSADTLTWLRVPITIRSEVGALVYKGTRSRASNDPPPGL